MKILLAVVVGIVAIIEFDGLKSQGLKFVPLN